MDHVNDVARVPDVGRRNDEAAIVGLLEREGAATIEQLMAASGMTWEQVFGLIDRLSRAKTIRLLRIGREYYVEKVGTA